MTKLGWIVRRVRRMYWREIPYRVAGVLRIAAQSRGFLSATHTPQVAADARWGRAWCRCPTHASDDASLFALARRTLDGHLEVFGRPVAMADGVPDWNVDPVTGQHIELTFGLSIDFRHLGEDVDIKFLWEVNRHLWWVPLAQCYALTGERAYLDRIGALLKSWLIACPYPMGANWSSPVEHGIRLVTWSIVWHLIGGAASPIFEGDEGDRLLRAWMDCIYQHVRFASDNYSQYSSANNHLVGEATGVFVAAQTWDRWLSVRGQGARAKSILEREVLRQFSPDGVNLEQAIGYHRFCLQFLLAAGLAGRANGDEFSASFWARIDAAMTFLAAMLDSSGRLPCIGDSDDGEVWGIAHGLKFNSDVSLLEIGAALSRRRDLQAKVANVSPQAGPQASWLLDSVPLQSDPVDLARLPRRFDEGGYRILVTNPDRDDEFRVTFDCGSLGLNRIAGHGHADALSVLVTWAGEALLVDAGTYCYNAAPAFRHFFRGTHAHNTVVVDGLDQSEYGGSFLWLRDVNCRLIVDAGQTPDRSVHACHDGYLRLPDPVVHHRRVTLAPGGMGLLVEDWLEGTEAHDVELLWHAGARARFSRGPESDETWLLAGERRTLRLALDPGVRAEVIEGRDAPPQGWVSSRFYERVPAPVLSARGRLLPGQVLQTRIDAVLG